MKEKNFKILILSCLLFLAILFGCEPAGAKEIRILTSFLPIHLFTLNVVGEREGVVVDFLIPGEVSPHDYHMRPSDMRKVARADAIIMNGLGLDDFVLASINDKKKVLKSAHVGELIEIDDGHDEGHDHDHSGRFNPHVWVSPKMAAHQVRGIVDFLSNLDPEGKGAYEKNGLNYEKKLIKLHQEMEAFAETLTKKNIITFHNSFDYLARDIGLQLAGTILGNENEAPAAGEMSRLINVAKKDEVRAIFSEPQFDSRMANLISKEAGKPVFVLDPVATGKPEKGYYLSVMEANLRVLQQALK